MSGGPPSDPQVGAALAGPPFLPCFHSFFFLESTDWLLIQHHHIKKNDEILEHGFSFLFLCVCGEGCHVNNTCDQNTIIHALHNVIVDRTT